MIIKEQMGLNITESPPNNKIYVSANKKNVNTP